MDNQHNLIKNYRDLSQEEINLMNKIKAYEEQGIELLREVISMHQVNYRTAQNNHVADQDNKVPMSYPWDNPSTAILFWSESLNWAADAKQDLQTTVMKMVRSVALPKPAKSLFQD